jgi:hypothetical protein
MIDASQFVKEFETKSGGRNGAEVVSGLDAGMNLLSEMLYLRLHQDVEKARGADSMLVPISEMRSRRTTLKEIASYQVAESTAAVRQFGYLPSGDEWYVSWLTGLLLKESSPDSTHRQRIDGYLSKTERARRLAMTDVLVAVLPDSRRAPLVLFLLFPLAIHITTALAFGDHAVAERLREQQIELLSIIPSCSQCCGRVLKNGDSCLQCANPLWNSEWLNSTE